MFSGSRTCTTNSFEKTTPFQFGQMGTPQQPALITDELEQTSTYNPLPKFQNNWMISQEALADFAATVWGTSPAHFFPQHMRRDEDKLKTAIEMENLCAPVVHPVTGETVSKYQTLAKDPVTKETWTTAWEKK